MEKYLEIGQIVNTFGIKGMVKIKPFTENTKKSLLSSSNYIFNIFNSYICNRNYRIYNSSNNICYNKLYNSSYNMYSK